MFLARMVRESAQDYTFSEFASIICVKLLPKRYVRLADMVSSLKMTSALAMSSRSAEFHSQWIFPESLGLYQKPCLILSMCSLGSGLEKPMVMKPMCVLGEPSRNEGT